MIGINAIFNLVVLLASYSVLVKCLRNDTLDLDRNYSRVNDTLPEFDEKKTILFGNRQINLNRDLMKHSSIIYGLTLIANTDDLSIQCYDELQKINDGINKKEIWAMKVFDSSGTQQPGFMWGHNFYLGSQKGCESAKTPLSITLSNRYQRNMKSNLIKGTAPFNVEYRMIYAKHQSAWQVEVKFLGENILHVGLCVPQSCTNDEIFNLTQKFLNERHLQAQEIFEFNAEVMLVKDLKLREHFWKKTSVILLGLITAITIVLMLLASSQKKEKKNVIEKNYSTVSLSEGSYLREPLENFEHSKEYSQKNLNDNIGDFLECFDTMKNLEMLFKTDANPQSIPVINGIKVIACFLILLFHMQWYTFFTLHNTSVMFHYAEQIEWQLISNAPLLVDVFFTISGFLVAYNFIRNKDRMKMIKQNGFLQNAKLYGRLVLHRYLRLSPLYLVINAIGEFATTYLVDTSKFWVFERSDINCQKYWWRNILYIQNFFHVDELCLNWTWSMACEMQYFLLFTFLLFIYVRNNILGKISFVLLASIALIANLILTVYLEFMPSYDVLYNTGTTLYIAPYSRIAPYFVGIFSGWLFAEMPESLKLVEDKSKRLWIWSSTFILLCMHSTIKRDFPFFVASSVIVIGRWLLGLSSVWIIMASVSGYDNWLTKFLSARFFIHVNKLTYAIYLLNPLIITIVFGISDNSVHADPIPALIMAFGITILSYLAAIIFSVFFEIPYCKVSNKILKMQSHRKLE